MKRILFNDFYLGLTSMVQNFEVKNQDFQEWFSRMNWELYNWRKRNNTFQIGTNIFYS